MNMRNVTQIRPWCWIKCGVVLGCYAMSFPVIANQQSNSISDPQRLSYPIVDTNQTVCFDVSKALKNCPESDEQTVGQDAQYHGYLPSYTDNKDGTVTDKITRLMWTQTADINGDGVINIDDKLTYDEAQRYSLSLQLGGYDDWRIPTIKELYSLILFDGQDPSGLNSSGEIAIIPFIDNKVFGFNSGDMNAGERLIDSQYVSSTKYVTTTMKGDETVFGVNFIDGRIKGYGLRSPKGGEKTFYVMAVRGNTDYGINHYIDNKDQTISDKSTGLVWQKSDSGMGLNWPMALSYCETLTFAGHSDWRLPNVKELHSIVDYSRSPETTHSAAIHTLFSVSSIVNESGKIDYPNFWSSTTHQNLKNGKNAAYVAFGRSLGYMGGQWMDVHGAGSQRSDPKTGNASQYPMGHGPQGDAIRVENYVRCVTGGSELSVQPPKTTLREGKAFVLTGMESRQKNSGASHANSLPSMGVQQRPSFGLPSKGGDPFTMMDANSDGKLSKQEVKGPLAKDFSRIDRNNDGYISKDEMPDVPLRR